MAGRVLRPLRTITTSVRNISATSLHDRLALDGPNDELKELGDTFDGLLGRLEASFQAQRTFVANASHELRTPLTRQRALAQVAITDPDATVESLRAAHERVLASGQEQERLIEALLVLARGQAGPKTQHPFDLADLAGDVLQIRASTARTSGLLVDARLSPAPAAGDRRLVRQLIGNLVDNAIQHNGSPGWIELTTDVRGGQAVLSVTNSGPTIPADEVDRIFEPFHRLGADRTNRGNRNGLGLSIVDAIATSHGATVTTRARPSGGLGIEVAFRCPLV
jgi:signal transduction histidine kinase